MRASTLSYVLCRILPPLCQRPTQASRAAAAASRSDAKALQQKASGEHLKARQYAAAALRWRHKEAACAQRAMAVNASAQQGDELAGDVQKTHSLLDATQHDLRCLMEQHVAAMAALSIHAARHSSG